MILTFDDPDGLDDNHIYFDNLDSDHIGANNELAVHDELNEYRAEYGGPNDDNPNGRAVLTPLDALKDHNPKLGEALSDGDNLGDAREQDALGYVHADHDGLNEVISVRLDPCRSSSVLPSHF